MFLLVPAVHGRPGGANTVCHSVKFYILFFAKFFNQQSSHRGLKLDGAIGQGEIFNSLKSEKFSKSFLSHIGKNKIKF